ncbi:hypothetical protein [Streptomyces sp. NPDC001388]|uniref:hypothetical protein n=1 Tax=unclassified Streptomyces TaxID=2593676 RepID=UPI003676BFBD
MHEMWVGAAPLGERPVWHVLAADRAVTLCGVPRSGSFEQDTTDLHCLPCMSAYQRLMASSDSAE